MSTPATPERAEPLWRRVELAIRAAIADGSWPPGSRIPGETELTEVHGVSRITVRHALANLAAEGLVRRQRGRGTFVRDTRLVAGTRALTSFSHEMAAIGVVADATLLDGATVPADAHVAEVLELEPGEPVVRIRRLRTGDGEPIGVQTSHLRADRVPGLDPLLTAGASLYDILRRDHGIVAQEAFEVFRVGTPNPADAAALGIGSRTPVFIVERASRDADGPFELTISTMRGDRYEIRSTLRAR